MSSKESKSVLERLFGLEMTPRDIQVEKKRPSKTTEKANKASVTTADSTKSKAEAKKATAVHAKPKKAKIKSEK